MSGLQSLGIILLLKVVSFKHGTQIPAREVLPMKVRNMPVFLCYLETGKHFSQRGCIRVRLRLHGIGYVQIRLGSDPLWTGSTLFTRDRFETGTLRFYIGSPS